MNNPFRILIFALSATLLATSCGESKKQVRPPRDEDPGVFDIEPVPVLGTDQNQLANEATEFLRSRSNDAVHWQQWSPELLETAGLEQRPIFVVVVDGKQPESTKFLDAFNDPKNRLADQFNDTYLCTLVDASAHPEMGIMAYHLSAEIKQSFSYPFVAWITHEGNPVGWVPIRQTDLKDLSTVISRSNSMVAEIWEESPSYFVKNSRMDNAARLARSEMIPLEESPQAEELQALLTAASGKLTALYDPATRAIDNTGGLVPTELLRFIAVSQKNPNLPNYVRTRGTKMLTESCQDIASNAITDPLDGGLFSARTSKDWTLPAFVKSSLTQSKMAMAYAYTYKATDQEYFAEEAMKLLTFFSHSDKSERPGIGSYQSVRKESFEDELFFWSMADLEDLLSPEQFAVVKMAYGISAEGNIPLYLDPNRRFFRRNILSPAKRPAEVAEALGLDQGQTEALLNSAAKTLLAHREAKADELGAFINETTRITATNATHAFALLTCGQMLDRPELLTEGRALLSFLKNKHYSEKNGLWRIPPIEGHRGVKARGHDYATLIQAVLLSYRLGLQAEDLQWAEALTRESLLVLTEEEENLIQEAPVNERVGILPVYSAGMIFHRSTWGVLLDSLERLSRLSAKPQFSEAATAIRLRLLAFSERAPLIHTDFLESLLVGTTDCVAILHGDTTAPAMVELHALLLEPRHQGLVLARPNVLSKGQHVQFNIPKTGDGVTLFRSERKLGTASTAQELETLLGGILSPK